MPNFERSAYSRRSNNNPYSYDKIFALVRNADNTSVLGRTSRVSVVIKDTESFHTELESMDDATYKNAAGSDLSAIFMPYQSHGGVSGSMPGFNSYLPTPDPKEVNFYSILPFQWSSGANSVVMDRWVATSGDSLGSLVSAEKHYIDMDRYRDLDYIRGVGLRLPIMGVGWGYTTDDDPWPSGGAGPSGTRYFKGDLQSGWQLDPSDYIAAPIDLRYDPERHVWTTTGSDIVRFKITATPLTGTPPVAMAKRFDGTVLKEPAFPIALAASHSINDEIYATKPKGGVIGNPTHQALPIEWQEVIRMPNGQYQFMHYMMLAQNMAGWGMPMGHPIMNIVET